MAHVTDNKLRMTLWNCNGALWTHPGRLEEILKVSDIVFLVETHQSPNRGLPRVDGFRWESVLSLDKPHVDTLLEDLEGLRYYFGERYIIG
jgi:hypothetical protein